MAESNLFSAFFMLAIVANTVLLAMTTAGEVHGQESPYHASPTVAQGCRRWRHKPPSGFLNSRRQALSFFSFFPCDASHLCFCPHLLCICPAGMSDRLSAALDLGNSIMTASPDFPLMLASKPDCLPTCIPFATAAPLLLGAEVSLFGFYCCQPLTTRCTIPLAIQPQVMFTLELAIKLTGLGFYGYFSSLANGTDAVIVALGLVELASTVCSGRGRDMLLCMSLHLSPSMQHICLHKAWLLCHPPQQMAMSGNAARSFRTLRILRSFRVLRLLKVFKVIRVCINEAHKLGMRAMSIVRECAARVHNRSLLGMPPHISNAHHAVPGLASYHCCCAHELSRLIHSHNSTHDSVVRLPSSRVMVTADWAPCCSAPAG